jgi:hypothetical protein
MVLLPVSPQWPAVSRRPKDTTYLTCSLLPPDPPSLLHSTPCIVAVYQHTLICAQEQLIQHTLTCWFESNISAGATTCSATFPPEDAITAAITPVLGSTIPPIVTAIPGDEESALTHVFLLPAKYTMGHYQPSSAGPPVFLVDPITNFLRNFLEGFCRCTCCGSIDHNFHKCPQHDNLGASALFYYNRMLAHKPMLHCANAHRYPPTSCLCQLPNYSLLLPYLQCH